MFLVVGLGNPGQRYSGTYHNMGFEAVDKLTSILCADKFKSDCDSLVAKAQIGGEELILAKPQTFMNLSGTAVKKLLKRYRIGLEKLIVVFDDVDIPRGEIRKRMSGSAGTHNGMRDIIAALETGNFARVRIGIGRPEEGELLADYVLSRVAYEHKAVMANALQGAADAVLELVGGNL